MLIRDDARSVRVGQDQVIEVRDEAHRDGRVLGWPGRLRQVKQLPSPLVAEQPKLWPELVESRRETCESRPRLEVGRGSRSERGQIPKCQRVRPVLRRQGLAQPLIGQGEIRVTGEPPLVLAGHQDQGEIRPDRVAHRPLVRVRVPLQQRSAYIRERPGPLREEPPGLGDQSIQVEAVHPIPEYRAHAQAQRRLERGAERHVISRGHQVQRAPHQGAPHDLAAFEQ